MWRHSTPSNSVGALRQVSIVSHSYQTYFGFPRSDLIFRCGLRDHVIMRFASGGIKARLWNKVISLCYFRVFLVFLEVFQCLCSSPCSSCQRHLIKKKEVIFHRFLSLHFSILRKKTKKKKKERQIEALVEIWIIIEILSQKTLLWET